MKSLTFCFLFFCLIQVQGEECKVNWEKKCAMCHGQDGKGDTPAGKKLKARDYTDPKVQAALKDEEMFKAIKEGIKKDSAVKMPAQPKLSDEEIKALIAHVRSLKSN